MRTLLPLLAVLSLAALARADMVPPGFTSISREVVLEFADPPVGWTFFAVSGFNRRVERIDTAASVALSKLVGDDYGSRRMGVTLYAIPDDVLAEIGSPTTESKWYERHAKDARVRRLEIGVLSESTTVADPRARVIETRRVTLTPTTFETELVSEKVEYGTGMCVSGVCVMFVVGLLWLVVWLFRRLIRRSVTRTAPPPGNEPANGAT